MTEEAPAPHTPPTMDARWLEPARLTKATVLISLALYACVLFALLNPDSMPQNQETFGDMAAKTGLPLWAFVTLAVSLACIPLPFAFWHFFRILFRGASEGTGISMFGMLRCLFTVPNRHPDLRISRWIVFLIFGSYLVAIFTFAYLADERDLERKRHESPTEEGATRH